MLGKAAQVYRSTRKKHDQLWNVWVARPIAAVVVAAVEGTRVTPNQLTLASLAVFVAGSVTLARWTEPLGALAAVAILEGSYVLDCADGMLARFRKAASQEGHLFDFFTDEGKALCLVAALAFRLFETGGLAPALSAEGLWRGARDPIFLGAGVLGVLVVASATSLTNFVRRPELSGKETPVDAHYENEERRRSVGALVLQFLRWLGHYPSHVWIFAIAGRLDAFLWMYLALQGAYLAQGWLGLARRFGRFPDRE